MDLQRGDLGNRTQDWEKNKKGFPLGIILFILFSIIITTAVLPTSKSNSIGNDNHSFANNNRNHGNHSVDQEHNTVFKVVIDPGHGGKDVGATSASGQYEKDFTLSVSKKVQALLEQEPRIQVFMTRTDDSYISQEGRYRPEYANRLNADVFVSIHGNTFTDSDVSGTETFYYHKHSRLFSRILQKHVVEATGFRDRGIAEKDLFVVKDTQMPAALIEIGYLTNPQDESEMWSDDFQNQVATAIVEGIKETILIMQTR